LRFSFILVFLLLFHNLNAQEKRSLSHQDYDDWESIGDKQISNDGNWVTIEISLQDGDGRLELLKEGSNKNKVSFPRLTNASFSSNSEWLIGLIKPEKDSLRQLKLQKLKKDDFPKDSLFLLELKSGEKVKIPEINGVKLPKEEKGWYAYHQTISVELDSSANNKESNEEKTFDLKVHEFGTERAYNFSEVLDYGFSDNGERLFVVRKELDSVATTKSVTILDLETGDTSKPIENFTSYKFPVFSFKGDQFAILASKTVLEEELKMYQLLIVDDQGNLKVLKEVPNVPAHNISEHYSPSFSESGKYLVFGWQPLPKDYPYLEDTTILKEERVEIDIWGWQDAEIQPMQIKNLKDKEKESKLAVYHMETDEIVDLGESNSSQVHFNRFKRGDWAIKRDNSPYRRNYSWDIQSGEDLSKINIKTGEVELLKENLIGSPRVSPAGNYVYWYNAPDSSWRAIDLESKMEIKLTAEIDDLFYNQLHDSPALPGSYGNAGWTTADEYFLVYGQYHIWKVDPLQTQKAQNLTKGGAEKVHMIYRFVNLDTKKDYFELNEEMVLRGVDQNTKSSGYFLGDWKGVNLPKKLVFGDANYSGLKVSKDKSHFIYQKSTFKNSPNVYYTNATFRKHEQLSEINTQQSSIKWGDVELVDFLSNDGDEMKGLLFKPENFDPQKKYPMMVYFYERRSDALHHYYSPVPSASIINIPYFVSNDYLVFVPDIKYKIGLPGPSAYDCIVPGVQAMIGKGFVDKENIGIQGQSWGGYQVAYVITRTNLFKAAGAGAPVVNMTSAYGGIRWGSGMSRMFQYEQTQSRIGGTLWEKPSHYIENSPLFFTDRVKTPTLIMHNDQDGAVPWDQGIEFFMALKRNNVPSWLLVYNGEDHNLKERKNKKDLSIRLSQFFDHYLKGAKAPLWMTEGIPAIEKGKTLKYELSEE
tara:strand:+ start:30350 stop:33130 length:2781 start_codon:yes stop_codon:yes gene_type:complete